jgi:autotransporter-associated beta strand protein
MKTILRTIRLALTLAMITLPAHAATNVWRGGILSTAWSEPNNWDPAVLPQDGATLIFPGGLLGTGGIMVNDLTNLIVSALIFDGGQAIYELQGNTLIISRGIFLTDQNDADVRIQCGLVLTQNIAMRVSYYSSGDPHISGPIELNGRMLTASPEKGASVTLSGVISGSGSLALGPGSPTFGFGTVKLSGSRANTFSGQVRLSSVLSDGGWVAFRDHMLGAKLELDKDSGPAVPGPLSIGTNCEVTLKQAHQIADLSAVSIRGGGGLKLEGNTETIGNLDLMGESNGAWAYGYHETLVDTGGATLSVEGNITSSYRFTNNMPVIKGQLGLPPGSHVINVSGTSPNGLDIQADIIGGGGFTKTGPAGLLLSGNSTFEGDAVLQEGTTYLYHANALSGPSGAAILEGGQLYLNSVAVGLKTLWVDEASPNTGGQGGSVVVSGIASWAGPVTLNTNLLLAGGIMTFSGPISGPAGLFTYNAGTHLEGPDANSYEGLTYVSGGLLQFNKPPGTRTIGPRLEVHSSSTVQWLQDYQCVGVEVRIFDGGRIDLFGHRDDFGPIIFTGGEISTGAAGEFGVYGLVTVNASSAEATINGRLGLPPGLHEFRVNDGAAFPDLRIDATVLGAGSLRKTGPGQMWLAASNSYEGLTTVAEGALSVLDPHGLGAAGTGTTVDDGATLEMNLAGATLPEPLAIRGTGFAGNGALGVFGDVTLRNPFPSIFAAIDLTTNATIGVAASSRLTVDGFISGIGPLTKAGRGTLVFANANPNSYSGETIVAEGTLELAKPHFAVAVPGDLVIGPVPFNSSATVRFFQNGGMRAGTIATINAGSLLDLNGNGQNLSRLNLNDGGDAQTGPGQLSFPIGGIVAVGSLGQLGSHSSSYLSGNVGLPANATLNFAVGAYAPTAPFDFKPELEMFAHVAAPGENPNLERAGISKNGPGTMLLTAGNSFNGRVEIFEGTLIAANNTCAGHRSNRALLRPPALARQLRGLHPAIDDQLEFAHLDRGVAFAHRHRNEQRRDQRSQRRAEVLQAVQALSRGLVPPANSFVSAITDVSPLGFGPELAKLRFVWLWCGSWWTDTACCTVGRRSRPAKRATHPPPARNWSAC